MHTNESSCPDVPLAPLQMVTAAICTCVDGRTADGVPDVAASDASWYGNATRPTYSRSGLCLPNWSVVGFCASGAKFAPSVWHDSQFMPLMRGDGTNVVCVPLATMYWNPSTLWQREQFALTIWSVPVVEPRPPAGGVLGIDSSSQSLYGSASPSKWLESLRTREEKFATVTLALRSAIES